WNVRRQICDGAAKPFAPAAPSQSILALQHETSTDLQQDIIDRVRNALRPIGRKQRSCQPIDLGRRRKFREQHPGSPAVPDVLVAIAQLLQLVGDALYGRDLHQTGYTDVEKLG